MTQINRAYFAVSNNPGTAGALTVSAAVSGPYRTLGASHDTMSLDVSITEGSTWEVRTGCVYSHATGSLSRGTLEDSSTGSAIPFTSAAKVLVTATANRLNSVLESGAPTLVSASRTLTAADNGATLECTATLTLTVPAGLPAGFSCNVLASGTTSVASSGGTLLNGATTTLTRAAATNVVLSIIGRSSAANNYIVTGV